MYVFMGYTSLLWFGYVSHMVQRLWSIAHGWAPIVVIVSELQLASRSCVSVLHGSTGPSEVGVGFAVL